MSNNLFMNKMILINLVYMYKQINGKIPSLYDIKRSISKINVEIDDCYIKKFLENLQKINFNEAEVNGRKRIEFIKKQKPLVQFINFLPNKNNENEPSVEKKEKKEEVKNDSYHSYSDTEVLYVI
uniref:Uncharacterized protein n=1 Tax=Lotharella vacuolata TaxID=74820 RepID=A0A0H5BKD3_9EUKA|nr:hypothetical protein [Lotharella vacuolata]